MLGFPIRKSWDHSFVDNSPRHIAASHVLHRLLVPRHPPCALQNLTTQIKSTKTQTQNQTSARHNDTPTSSLAIRCSHPLYKSQTTHKPAATRTNHTPHRAGIHTHDQSTQKTHNVFPQDPTGCLCIKAKCAAYTHQRAQMLLRKEVIQPHLPVRLPCYDFVPIASPTFDRSLPYRLGHGLRVLPTFMT